MPAAAGSAAAASDAGVLGEESPQFPTNIQSFSAVPLGSLVDTKIKERIWSNQYIDLGLLISEAAHETTYLSSTLSFEQNSTHRIKTINSIEQWSDAFLIFMAIYTQHCPSDTQEIMKYMQLIRTMSRDAPSRVFLAYDRDFRKLRTHFTLPWCLLHQELFYSVSKAAGIQGRPSPTSIARFPNVDSLLLNASPFQQAIALPFAVKAIAPTRTAALPTNAPHAMAHMPCPSAQAVVMSPNSNDLPPPSIAQFHPSNAQLSPPLRLPTPVHVVRLWQLLLESRYDPALSRDICSGFTYGFPLSFQGDLSHRATTHLC